MCFTLGSLGPVGTRGVCMRQCETYSVDWCQPYPDLWTCPKGNVNHMSFARVSVSPGLVGVYVFKCVSHHIHARAYVDRAPAFPRQNVPHISSGQIVSDRTCGRMRIQMCLTFCLTGCTHQPDFRVPLKSMCLALGIYCGSDKPLSVRHI